MSEPRPVLFLDPYHTASHRLLAEALERRSRHRVTLLTLPPRKWKWRMRGAALALESRIRSLPPPAPEVLITTDFMNLSELLALTRALWPSPPRVIVYFHENQLTYPAGSADVRDFHFGLVNLYSALAADRVLFNSRFHLEEFLGGVDSLLRLMPDFRPEGIAERIRARSEVLGVPLDLEEMDAAREEAGDLPADAAEEEAAPARGARTSGPPTPKSPCVVWNHRWEEDRDPETFFAAMETLDAMAAEGRAPDFTLAVVGQNYRERPAVFDRARERLARRIERWGFVESRREYLRLLARAAVVVSTSRHEFFGVSVMEAIYLGCAPVLPRRLTYPEIVEGEGDFLYDDPAEIAPKVAAALARASAGRPDPRGLRRDPRLDRLAERIRVHEAGRVVARWDEIIEEVSGPASVLPRPRRVV